MEQFYCPMSLNKVRQSSLPKMNSGINFFEIYLLEQFKEIRENVFYTNKESFQLALQVRNLTAEIWRKSKLKTRSLNF